MGVFQKPDTGLLPAIDSLQGNLSVMSAKPLVALTLLGSLLSACAVAPVKTAPEIRPAPALPA